MGVFMMFIRRSIKIFSLEPKKTLNRDTRSKCALIKADNVAERGLILHHYFYWPANRVHVRFKHSYHVL